MSPRARRVARELGLDWQVLKGSGRQGRIRERDVRAAAATRDGGRPAPRTSLRIVIAERMAASARSTAPVTLITKADATNLVSLRRRLRDAAGGAPGYTDLLVWLTARTLCRHPALHALWRDDGLFLSDTIDIGIAVDTDAGLLAPVLRDVQSLTLQQIIAKARILIELARARRLTAEQMLGGTFTVTNLGMYGIDAFTPIINLPQVAILGVGRIVREPAVVEERIEVRAMMTLSLTFDHRAVDGGPAARFLDSLRRSVEQTDATLEPSKNE